MTLGTVPNEKELHWGTVPNEKELHWGTAPNERQHLHWVKLTNEAKLLVLFVPSVRYSLSCSVYTIYSQKITARKPGCMASP